MNHWMFRCQDVSRKVSQSMDGSLAFHQHLAIRIHLMMCRYCRRFRRQLMMFRKISLFEDLEPPKGETPEKLSQETKARIKEKLRSSL
jgi:hypothetical protein